MSGLKQELGLGQGVGLLSTSLLGTGVFAVPALAALVAGDNSLWAWPLLILLVFPIAIVFALLGRHFPSAGGVAHFVDMAFGPRLASVTGWLFLSVIPVGLPAALHIATGFGQALFGWHDAQLLLAELGTLAIVWVGRFAWRQLQRQPADVGCRTDCGADRRSLVARRDKPGADPLPGPGGD
ncbi:permease [Klebsiella pneumoniae]|nr:permease [Klebsiella pneumoniae]